MYVPRNHEEVRDVLMRPRVRQRFPALTDRIVLPEQLELACITWNSRRLRVTAIRKRAGWVRDEEYDETQKESDDGRPVWLKGYVFHELNRSSEIQFVSHCRGEGCPEQASDSAYGPSAAPC